MSEGLPDIVMSDFITVFWDHQDAQWVCDIGEMDIVFAEGILAAVLRYMHESSPEVQIRWKGGRSTEDEEDDDE